MANSKISALTSATTPLAGTETLPIVQSGTTKQVSVANLTVGRSVNVATLLATGGYSTVTITSTTGGAKTINIGSDAFTNAFIGTTTAHNLSLVSNAAIVAEVTTAGNFSVNTGNVVIGTSGKGIDFSATPGTGTSELFADYEEGTFTPTVIGPTAGSATYSTQVGKYTKIGNVVNILIDLTWTAGTGSGGFLAVTGLPFTIGGSNTALAGYISDIALTASNIPVYLANVSSTTIYIQQIPVGGGSRSNINYDAAGSATISGTYFV